MEAQLKQACQLTGAKWVALAEREGGQWLIRFAYRLSKSKQLVLSQFLAQESMDLWLCGALKEGKNLVRASTLDLKLDGPRFYIFPIPESTCILLVAGNRLSANHQDVWMLVSGLIKLGNQTPTNDLLPEIQTELSYDMPRALDRVLSSFVPFANPQGAWLAIRRGDTLDVVAQINATQGTSPSISLDSSPLLHRLSRTLMDVSVRKGQAEWSRIPYAKVNSDTKIWCCFPLIVGKRMIGAVALWSRSELEADEWSKLRDVAKRVSSSVEVIVTFSELANHLRRLGMLNDFALTISSAQNIDQIARRVFGLLARSFSADLISLYIPSADGRLMREFTNHDGRFTVQNAALTGHPVSAFLKNGRVLRIGDTTVAEINPINSDARSFLLVPLMYRRRTIGLLSLESLRTEAFAQSDEHLMVVIASYLAGLVEYGRLREEAEARARNLGLIHEVVQQIIGLSNKTDVAQITADLIAQFFGYELAGVMLFGDRGGLTILGIGGSHAGIVRHEIEQMDFPAKDGIISQVFITGENILVNDTTHDGLYKPLRSWNAGSEICVALKDGGRILGIIDVESSQQNAFSDNDLIAMESLAGVLAAVVSNADQYEHQMETVRQLRSAQIELKTRMNAQQDAERRLLQAAKLAAVGEMAAGIAHELNNPLTTVTGFSELILEETSSDAPHRADVELILKEARRARDVVRRLLDFARQGERARSKTDINEIIEDVLTLTRHLIHTSGVQLSLELAKDPPWVSVDTNQMKQVFLNLIHNALQAMPSGGILDIQTSARTRDGHQWIAIVIRDSGVGIESKNKDRIFEPFFTTKGNMGGTGLGLSVTYGIVTDHGGTIDVKSLPGKGSTFTVWLPL